MRRFVSLVLLTMCLVLGGCGEGEAPISNDRLVESFEQGRTGIWVSARGPVLETLGDELVAGKMRQRFSLRLTENIIIQVRHSVEDSERVPVEPGDMVSVQGYYQWDARGGFISQTHHDPAQPGSGGWIEVDGKRYD